MNSSVKYCYVVALMLVIGCSTDSGPTPPTDEKRDSDYLQQGWKDFKEGRYDAAILNFNEAFNKGTSGSLRAEAICGRGWSNAYKRELSKARSDFAFALGTTGITTDVQLDVRAGGAIVAHALNDFVEAISLAQSVLTQRPTYTFVHDSKVTARRLRLLLAQSYYADGQFTQAASQMDLFDPSQAPHPTEPALLLPKILAALQSL